MRLVPEIHLPVGHIGSRVLNTGNFVVTGMAYLLVGLMLVTMLVETCLTVLRAYS
jgi:hypothetical protein